MSIRIKIISALIHVNEWLIFYPRLRKFYKSVIAGDNPTIIDVGSNKGQTIDFFLSNFKNARIYGFEPNPVLYNNLIKKYKSNSNVSIKNCGISDISGKLLFNETVTNETSTFEELNYDSDYLKMKSKVLGVKPENIIKKSYEVDVITLHDFLTTNNVGKVDVLKIDTEGHEYKCLLGLFNNKLPDVNYIQLEQHNDDMYTNKASEDTINSFLKKNKFNLFKKIQHGFGDFEEVIYQKAN
jgi:FkbM family methyltransferase